MKYQGVKPGKPIIITLTPEEGLALLSQNTVKHSNKMKGIDDPLCSEKTPNPDDVKSYKTVEVSSLMSKASP
jgi:hypothetical protein